MHKFIAIVCLLFTCTLFYYCNPSPKTINRSFYHWKQSFEWTATDSLLLQQLQLNTLYIRFFDIIWEPPKEAIPTAIIDFKSPVPSSVNIIPCIYIENNVFKKYYTGNAVDIKKTLNKEVIQDLAQKTAKKIQALFPTNHPHPLPEIQIDCDWTASTQQAYFYFLEAFKKANPTPIQLSATIRLHQIKYADKTGVPPVDKGLLMYYNMGKVKEMDTKNSILDNTIGQQYINDKTTYALPLDLALPIFEWGVLYQNGRFAGIINGLNQAQLDTIGVFKTAVPPAWKRFKGAGYAPNETPIFHMVEEEMVLGDRFLRIGDFIRLEGVQQQALWQAAQICRPVLGTNDTHLAFYHWQPSLINQQSYETLDSLYRYFE